MKEPTHGLFARLYRFIMEGDLSPAAIIAFSASVVTLAVLGIMIKRILGIKEK